MAHDFGTEVDLTGGPEGSYVRTMSTATTVTEVPIRLDVDAYAPTFSRALTHLDHATTKECDRVGLDLRLRELLRLRVSQLNGCAYCVDMHAQNARAVGENQRRLDALPVWQETGFFSPAERAALNLAEEMVKMAENHVRAGVQQRRRALQHRPGRRPRRGDRHRHRLERRRCVHPAWPPGSYQP